MAKYNNEELSEICESVNLLDYASTKLSFTKVGNKFFTSCPLHSDSTPSLCIDNNINRFRCYGCGVYGSPIDYLVKVEGFNFPDAVDKLIELSGRDVKKLKVCDSMAMFKKLKHRAEKSDIMVCANRSILPSNYYDSFDSTIPNEWIDEGISKDAINLYEIRIDNKKNRIVYPVYDQNGNLITVKGRTRFNNFKELKIAKYINYHKIDMVDYFMGMKQNKDYILRESRVIIFEGIKSCMKLYDYGDRCSLAAETSHLSKEQMQLLIKMGIKDITIAFDKGISMDKIIDNVSMLRNFSNVYIVSDINGLLDDKMSPVDAGKDIWCKLYDERISVS